MRTAQIKLMQLIAHNLGATLRRLVARELVIEKVSPATKYFFCFRSRSGSAVGRVFHTDWTLHHQAWVNRGLAGGSLPSVPSRKRPTERKGGCLNGGTRLSFMVTSLEREVLKLYFSFSSSTCLTVVEVGWAEAAFALIRPRGTSMAPVLRVAQQGFPGAGEKQKPRPRRA